MIRRFLPHPATSLLLLVTWLLLVDSLSFGQWLLGGALAVLIPLLCNPLMLEHPRAWRPARLARFILLVLWDILVANFLVARQTLGPIRRLQPGFVEVPIDLDNEMAISLLVCVVSLTPGSVSADLSGDRRILLVHALDVPDADALVAEIKQRYEAPLKEVFPCSRT